MLTAKEIGNYIASPGAIRQEDLEELKAMTDKYPYSQLFSILYLKGMSANNSIDFESALKAHSYRISDRAQLYRLIHDHAETFEPVPEKTEVAETSTSEPEQVEAEAPIIELHTTEAEEISHESLVSIKVETENTETATEQEVLETESVQDITKNIAESIAEETIAEVEEEIGETIEAPEDTEPEYVDANEEESAQEEIIVEFDIDETLDEPEEAPSTVPNDLLEESILHHAYASHYQLEDLSAEEEEALERRQEATEVKTEAEPEVTEVKDEIQETISIDSKQSFTGWLHANSNYSAPVDVDKEAINSVVSDFSEFDPMQSLFGENEKPRKEFFSPSKKARESLSEEQLPVSETLAKIYIMQGNYPMAIKAYQELSLAFPEKKIFFANQIEDLQKKLNR